MQSPVPRSNKRLFGRKLRPVHEKQQRDGRIRQPANRHCRLAAGRHHGGQCNRQQDGREEPVDVGPDGAEQNHFEPRLQPIALDISAIQSL